MKRRIPEQKHLMILKYQIEEQEKPRAVTDLLILAATFS